MGAQLCIAVLHKCRANGTKLGRQTVYSGLQHDNGLVVRYETPWRCLCQRVDIRLGWLPAQFCGITIYVNVTAGNMAACFMPLRVLCTALFSIFSQKCCMFMCCAFNLLFHMLHADESAGTEVQIAQIWWSLNMKTMSRQSCNLLELMASQNCTSTLVCCNINVALTHGKVYAARPSEWQKADQMVPELLLGWGTGSCKYCPPSVTLMYSIRSPAWHSCRRSAPSTTYPKTAYLPSKRLAPVGVNSDSCIIKHALEIDHTLVPCIHAELGHTAWNCI